MSSEKKCNHPGSTATSNFCIDCGKSLRPPREPGEIKLMIEQLKQTGSPSSPVDGVFYLIKYICMNTTLRWCLGEINNAQLVALLEKSEDEAHETDSS